MSRFGGVRISELSSDILLNEFDNFDVFNFAGRVPELEVRSMLAVVLFAHIVAFLFLASHDFHEQ